MGEGGGDQRCLFDHWEMSAVLGDDDFGLGVHGTRGFQRSDRDVAVVPAPDDQRRPAPGAEPEVSVLLDVTGFAFAEADKK